MKIGDNVKYTMFDKRSATELHNKFNEAMRKFAEENGLEFQRTNAKFGTFEFTKKVQFKIASQASAATQELDEKFKFQRFAVKNGISSAIFNKVVNIGGVDYRVVGVNTRAHKKPIKLVRVRDNRSFKCPVIYVKGVA
jgi:hypothetical protein